MVEFAAVCAAAAAVCAAAKALSKAVGIVFPLATRAALSEVNKVLTYKASSAAVFAVMAAW